MCTYIQICIYLCCTHSLLLTTNCLPPQLKGRRPTSCGPWLSPYEGAVPRAWRRLSGANLPFTRILAIINSDLLSPSNTIILTRLYRPKNTVLARITGRPGYRSRGCDNAKLIRLPKIVRIRQILVVVRATCTRYPVHMMRSVFAVGPIAQLILVATTICAV